MKAPTKKQLYSDLKEAIRWIQRLRDENAKLRMVVADLKERVSDLTGGPPPHQKIHYEGMGAT